VIGSFAANSVTSFFSNSRSTVTVMRCDTLASNTRGWAAQLKAGDVVRRPAIARTALVDERDIATAAVEVLLRRDSGTARDPNGPDGERPRRLTTETDGQAVVALTTCRQPSASLITPGTITSRALRDRRRHRP
jgi:hypothetical protein